MNTRYLLSLFSEPPKVWIPTFFSVLKRSRVLTVAYSDSIGIQLLLNTDQLKFGGLGRLEKTTILRTSESL